MSELTRRDRFAAWLATGPVGRFVAFVLDLAAASWRWRRGRSDPKRSR